MMKDIISVLKNRAELADKVRELEADVQKDKEKIWAWITSHKYWVEWLAYITRTIPSEIKEFCSEVRIPPHFDLILEGETFDIRLHMPNHPNKGWVYADSVPVEFLDPDKINGVGKDYIKLNKDYFERCLREVESDISRHQDLLREAENKKEELLKTFKG